MNTISLYRFYNMNKSDYGEPFALCQKHRQVQRIPELCILDKIADKAIDLCVKCLEDR